MRMDARMLAEVAEHEPDALSQEGARLFENNKWRTYLIAEKILLSF